MKIFDKNNLIRTYRYYSLRETTPDLLRTIYVARRGSLSKLSKKFGRENVEVQLDTKHIKKIECDTWETTADGIDMIKTLYKKPSPIKTIKSMILGNSGKTL